MSGFSSVELISYEHVHDQYYSEYLQCMSQYNITVLSNL